MAERKGAAPSSASGGGEPAPSFEEALERLESIVEELEGGSLTLEESIARYEEGVRLSQRLTQTLDEAEKRIERLVAAESGGEPGTAPMELDERAPGEAASGDAEAGRSGPSPVRREEQTAPHRREEGATPSRPENRTASPLPKEGAAPRPYASSDPDELPF